MAAFPGEGIQDLSRRLRIARAGLARLRVRRALAEAETELGLLGWEQVDFFDHAINAEVEKVREFENTQASLVNTSAELSGRKAALEQELATEKTRHEVAAAALAAERAPIAAQLEESEARLRQRIDAVERFDRAVEELNRNEKDLEARARFFREISNLDAGARAESRDVSDALGRLPGERKLVLADKSAAAMEIARLEPEVGQLRTEVRRIEGEIEAERERTAAAARRITGEGRQLDREQKQSNVHMSRLDRKKRSPYRAIGACLADHGIAPLNQPAVLERVFTLREREASLGEELGGLRGDCARAPAVAVAAFYLVTSFFLLGLLVAAWRMM